MWCYPQKDLDFLLWPRLLVTAEFGWSGDEKKNLTEFLHRSEKMVDLLRQLCAVDVGPIYPRT
jgi:N-acetyl-beta-hexosaminidase